MRRGVGCHAIRPGIAFRRGDRQRPRQSHAQDDGGEPRRHAAGEIGEREPEFPAFPQGGGFKGKRRERRITPEKPRQHDQS